MSLHTKVVQQKNFHRWFISCLKLWENFFKNLKKTIHGFHGFFLPKQNKLVTKIQTALYYTNGAATDSKNKTKKKKQQMYLLTKWKRKTAYILFIKKGNNVFAFAIAKLFVSLSLVQPTILI